MSFDKWCEEEEARWYDDKNYYRIRLVLTMAAFSGVLSWFLITMGEAIGWW